VQRIGALQEDYDLTVGVPALVGELFGDEARELVGDLRPVTGQSVGIGRAEQHGVAVGDQPVPAGLLADVVLGFPEQRLHHFLGNDAATEDPR